MKESKQIVGGIFMALLTSLIILGGALLSLSENRKGRMANASPTELIDEEGIPTLIFILPMVSSLTAQEPVIATATPTPSLTPLAECPIPSGWMTIILESEESTESVAQRYGITVSELAGGNCWNYAPTKLLSGTSLYIPAPDANLSLTPGLGCRPQAEQACVPLEIPTILPTNTATSSCQLRSDWHAYIVQPGDTLYSISRLTGVPVYTLQRGNCMGNSTAIHPGQTLLVPILPQPPQPPTSTPRPPAPSHRTPTPTPGNVIKPPPTTPPQPPVTSPTLISTIPQHPPPIPPVNTVPPPVVTSPVSTLPSHPPDPTSVIPVIQPASPTTPFPASLGQGAGPSMPI